MSVAYESSAPYITASNVNIASDATNGSIAYTIGNSVTGGELTAALTEASDWLTVGAVNASSVAFTSTANTGTARSATVRLTYTYDTDKTVTKDVTVTQAKKVVNYTYNLANAVIPGRHYIIASGTNGSVKAMGAQNGNYSFSIDDIMNMGDKSDPLSKDAAKAEEKAPDASGEGAAEDVNPPRPHFVREKTGEKIFITKDEFKIGKSKVHSDYSIENNSGISRVHIII